MNGLEQAEAHVAGRVGLAAAIAEHVAFGPAAVHAGLAALGSRTRRRLADELSGTWEVVEDLDEPSATVTVRPREAIDLAGLRAELIARDGIVTTYVGLERAPGEMTTPTLRVSGHLDTTDEDVDALARALLRRS
jgi:pyridoxal 5-phosphate dependent beta-lyase